MKLFADWRGYGYCTTCNTNAQDQCKWWFGRFPTRGGFRRLLPHKDRESYIQYLVRYARILSIHHGRTITPEDVKRYENGEINHDDRKR